MNIYVIVLRLVHIMGGVFWVGSAWMLARFLDPTARAAGPEGQRFMGRLMQQSRLQVYISVAAILTVVAGALLYYKDFGLKLAVIMTPVGLGFTIGAIFAILGLIVGGAVTGPVSARLAKLGSEIQVGGKPPTPEQAADLQNLQDRMSAAAKWTAVLTGLALLFNGDCPLSLRRVSPPRLKVGDFAPDAEVRPASGAAIRCCDGLSLVKKIPNCAS